MGIGRRLMETLETDALANDLHSLFAFTYVDGFFRKLGYQEVDRGELPLKAWKDCLRCPKFQACDEIAMLKRLKPIGMSAFPLRLTQISEFSQLPMMRK
jgi:amino-acid N-acetyltransferase